VKPRVAWCQARLTQGQDLRHRARKPVPEIAARGCKNRCGGALG
jgi:hypothetical protein